MVLVDMVVGWMHVGIPLKTPSLSPEFSPVVVGKQFSAAAVVLFMDEKAVSTGVPWS